MRRQMIQKLHIMEFKIFQGKLLKEKGNKLLKNTRRRLFFCNLQNFPDKLIPENFFLIILHVNLRSPITDHLHNIMEREKGFEPSTPTLARLCSTTELFPLSSYCQDISMIKTFFKMILGEF